MVEKPKEKPKEKLQAASPIDSLINFFRRSPGGLFGTPKKVENAVLQCIWANVMKKLPNGLHFKTSKSHYNGWVFHQNQLTFFQYCKNNIWNRIPILYGPSKVTSKIVYPAVSRHVWNLHIPLMVLKLRIPRSYSPNVFWGQVVIF